MRTVLSVICSVIKHLTWRVSEGFVRPSIGINLLPPDCGGAVGSIPKHLLLRVEIRAPVANRMARRVHLNNL
tara:strand:- start:927 stop:1142 length:216 start_codon:yes stop_codon:yes gene_type:complete